MKKIIILMFFSALSFFLIAINLNGKELDNDIKSFQLPKVLDNKNQIVMNKKSFNDIKSIKNTLLKLNKFIDANDNLFNGYYFVFIAEDDLNVNIVNIFQRNDFNTINIEQSTIVLNSILNNNNTLSLSVEIINNSKNENMKSCINLVNSKINIPAINIINGSTFLSKSKFNEKYYYLFLVNINKQS